MDTNLKLVQINFYISSRILLVDLKEVKRLSGLDDLVSFYQFEDNFRIIWLFFDCLKRIQIKINKKKKIKRNQSVHIRGRLYKII